MKTKGNLFEAVAERVLQRLAEHQFLHWPAAINTVLEPISTALSAHHTAAPTPTSCLSADEGMTLSAAFEIWCVRKGIAPHDLRKTAGDWALAVKRFRELCRTEDVRLITSRMVSDFRDQVTLLPARPKKEIGTLPC